jgi:hypothetical protein
MGHTPGPWYANQDCIEIDGPEGPRDVTLAVVLQADNAAADARLIAAAPELLAMCQAMAGDLQALLDGDDFSGMSDAEMFGVMLRSLNAAIAKAEGRSK